MVDFDRELFDKAREMKLEEAIHTLREMSEEKKEALAALLNEAANADGKVQEAELRTIYDIFSRAGMNFDHL